MLNKAQKCPFRNNCPKYRSRECVKVERFRECGAYDDFVLESSGTQEIIIKNVLEKLGKPDKREIKSEKKDEEIPEKCPFIRNCYLTFEEPCNNSRLNHECLDFECEDCELNIPDYGVYCKTSKYKMCETYENLTVIKEAYESMGINSTKDLKEEYGEENYEWLGGFIRCAFLEPKNID